MSSMVPISLRDPFFEDSYFSNSRHEFESMRRDMMKEAKDFWNKVDDDTLDLREPVTRRATTTVSSGPEESLTSRRLYSRDVSNPATSLPRWFMPRSSGEASSAVVSGDRQIMRIKEDDQKFEITLDVHDYRPEELKVRTQPDNTIIIEGKHEERSKDAKGGASSNNYNAVLQQFSRQYSLPPSCVPHRVVSNLSRDGVLVVTAPKDTKDTTIKDRNIPIRH
eukprot:maker-scaffold246_size239296-snap-gene-1.32 protein:Tk01935 transcript:maker-scaffold246_size239296-snap-gene-1.32-mRNA-1 annotation:"lethal2essential for life"